MHLCGSSWILDKSPKGDKGTLSREVGQVASCRQGPEWNMGTLGHIRKPLVKGQERALGAVPKYLSR